MRDRSPHPSTADKIFILTFVVVLFGITLYVSGGQVLTSGIVTGILGAVFALLLNRWFARIDRRRHR